MLKRLLMKKKPRIFLGSLPVPPYAEDGRFLLKKEPSVDTKLLKKLEKLFISLPSITEVDTPLDSDLVLDVVITKFQLGAAGGINLGEIGLPIFFRSSIEIHSRLYFSKTKQTKITFSVTEKLSWRRSFYQLINVRTFFGLYPVFDEQDMDYLLYKACKTLLMKMKKKKYDI